MKRNSSKWPNATLLLDVWLVSHLTARLLDDALRPQGLTGDEFGLYSLIYSGGPVTPRQISRWTGMAQTTVSGMLRRLAARGHLDDTPHPDDARSRLISLSDGGREVTARAASVLAEVLPRLNDALNDEQDAIRAKLSDLDVGLRRLIDAAPRPYVVPGVGQPRDRATLSYPEPDLSPLQTQEVCDFIGWLRTRDRRRPEGAANRDG